MTWLSLGAPTPPWKKRWKWQKPSGRERSYPALRHLKIQIIGLIWRTAARIVEVPAISSRPANWNTPHVGTSTPHRSSTHHTLCMCARNYMQGVLFALLEATQIKLTRSDCSNHHWKCGNFSKGFVSSENTPVFRSFSQLADSRMLIGRPLYQALPWPEAKGTSGCIPT